MKYFAIKEPNYNWYDFEFRCPEDHCSNCKLRFQCFTNKTVVIEDTNLVNKIYDAVYLSKQGSYQQRKARKMFFEYLGVSVNG